MSRAAAVVVLAATALLALVLVTFRAGNRDLGERPAPVFRLPSRAGQPIALKDLQGKVVLVNFWATWCPPCVAETPSLEALHRGVQARGLVVLGVSVDTDRAVLDRFVVDQGVTYPVLLDPAGITPRRYGTSKYPESYLVDGSGTIVRKYVGAVDWSSPAIRAEIEGALAR